MRPLDNLAVRHRIWALISVAALGSLVAAGLALLRIDDLLFQERGAQVRAVVMAAHAQAGLFQGRVAKGELTDEEAKRLAIQAIGAIRYEGDNYVWINDMHPRMVHHPIKPELNGQDLSSHQDPNGFALFLAMVERVKGAGEGVVPYQWPKPGSAQPVDKISFVKGFQPWGWILGSGVYTDDLKTAFWRNATDLALIALGFLALLLSFGALIARSVTQPLRFMGQAMRGIAEGNGDLRVRLETQGRNEISALAEAFNLCMDRITGLVLQVKDATRDLLGAAQGLASLTERNRGHMAHQQGEMQQVATAVTEMAATVREIARSAEAAENAAQSADQETDQGRRIVTQVQGSINGLAQAVERSTEVIQRLHTGSEAIGGVVDVIRGIAEQTNLLALNAAIEAARAGDQGRGFAVVADEVRTLANRTQQSTREIQQMIQALQAGAEEAVGAIRQGRDATQDTVRQATQAEDSLGGIARAVSTIKDMNAQIASAAEEQSTAAQEIDRGVISLQGLANHTTDAIQDIARCGGELLALGNRLEGLVGQFRTASA